MDFAGLAREKGHPRTPETGIKQLSEIGITPQKTLGQGIIINACILAIALILLEVIGKINIFTVSGLLGLQIIYFYYCLVEIPVGYVGIPLLFKKRNEPWSWMYTEGWLWTLRPLFDVEIINMQERVLDLHDDENQHKFEVNAASARNRKKKERELKKDPQKADEPTKLPETEVVPVLIDAYALWQIWDPWRILSVGEEAIERGINNHVIAAVRDEATNFTESEIRSDKNKLEQAAQKAADEMTDPRGVWVKEISFRNVTPKSPKVVEAHESAVIERHRADASAHVLKGAEWFKKFGLSPLDAVTANDDGHGRMRGRKQFIFSGQSNADDPHGIIRGAAIHSDESPDTPSPKAPKSKK